MQIHSEPPTAKRAAADERSDLMYCRMGMLGLDYYAIECDDPKTFEDLKARCAACDYRDACAVDLERDPNNPVWETYCPNFGTFNALSTVWWLTR
jgi:hypothetical protein